LFCKDNRQWSSRWSETFIPDQREDPEDRSSETGIQVTK
jgi:hypothetical protein